MNREQEDLIAIGIWLLIKHSDKIRSSEKIVWMGDYDKLFGEEESKEMPYEESLNDAKVKNNEVKKDE